MSWIIPIWSIAAGVCLSLAALHFLVWLRSRASLVNVLFSLAALAGCAIALQEMVLMRVQTPAEYGELLRWMHVSAAVIIIAIVWIVRLHLRAGRVWLAWLISGLRIVVLLANFLTSPNATFREITGLRFVPWLGEVVSIPVGEPSPYRILIHVCTVLLLIYILDAGVTAWRRGDRRRAAFLSGPIAAAILLSVLFSQLMVWNVVPGPFIGLVFLLIVMAMALELSMDLIHARQNALDLRRSEERLSLAARAAELGLWEWDVARDEIWVTDVGRKRVGAGDSDRIDFKRFLQSVHPDDREPTQKLVEHSLGTGAPLEAEYRVVAVNGVTRWVNLRGEVERDAKGIACSVRGISLDITSRKQAELQLQDLQEDLSQASRVSTMNHLAAALAHEISQPLGAILRNAEAGELFLQRDPPDLKELTAILADIRRDDQRAGAVIERLRSLMKRHQPALQDLSVKGLLDDAAALIRAELQEQRVHLTIQLPQDLPPVRGDRVQLQQVLLNVILNGLQAMNGLPPEQRRLVVQAHRLDEQLLEVSVKDSGPGIQVERLADLFEPFQTTKSEGLGIGLAISRVIVESHGGSIRAENNPAGGATFRLTLKVADGERNRLPDH